MKKKKKKESYARQIYNNTCILSQCSSIKSNGQSLLNLVSETEDLAHEEIHYYFYLPRSRPKI